MAKDVELDRLKTAQDLAYQRTQLAYTAQQSAWERRSTARNALNRAYEAKQRAYEQQNNAWQHYQSVRSANGPQIDALNAQQASAYQNMKDAFDRASNAYASRDGKAASSYAAEGHDYEAESKGYVAERRMLVEAIRSAKQDHEDYKPAFQRAKADYDAARQTHDTAKAEHIRAQDAFKKAKESFDEAAKLFRARLELVKAEGKKRNENRRALARQAGVPAQYLDKVWVTHKSDGSVNIYFGGIGEPNGPGHGHYAMDATGKVTYKREPHNAHGAQNFTDAQSDYFDVVGQQPSTGDFGFRCRFRGYDAYVETNTNREGRAKIDIYYGPNGPFGPGHHHTIAYRESPFDFVYDGLR